MSKNIVFLICFIVPVSCSPVNNDLHKSGMEQGSTEDQVILPVNAPSDGRIAIEIVYKVINDVNHTQGFQLVYADTVYREINSEISAIEHALSYSKDDTTSYFIIAGNDEYSCAYYGYIASGKLNKIGECDRRMKFIGTGLRGTGSIKDHLLVMHPGRGWSGSGMQSPIIYLNLITGDIRPTDMIGYHAIFTNAGIAFFQADHLSPRFGDVAIYDGSNFRYIELKEGHNLFALAKLSIEGEEHLVVQSLFSEGVNLSYYHMKDLEKTNEFTIEGMLLAQVPFECGSSEYLSGLILNKIQRPAIITHEGDVIEYAGFDSIIPFKSSSGQTGVRLYDIDFDNEVLRDSVVYVDC